MYRTSLEIGLSVDDVPFPRVNSILTTLTNLCEDWRCHGGGKQSQAYGAGGGGTSATSMFLFQRLSTRKLRYPLKNDGWKRIFFLWNWPLFRGHVI